MTTEETPLYGPLPADAVAMLAVHNGDIGKAVCAVMADVRRLEKQHKNEFAKYRFTSSDDFKDAIRPLLAKNGLWVRLQERDLKFQEVRNDKEKQTFVAVYHFTIQLCHATGSEEPEHITVALPFTGAQTTGAARSYAVKEWFKGKFLMSSGDVDAEADLTGHESGERLSKAEARDVYATLQAELLGVSETALSAKAIEEWYIENKYRVEVLPKDWEVQFHTAAVAAWKAFAKKPANKVQEPDWTAIMNELEGDILDARNAASLAKLEAEWTARKQKEGWPASSWLSIKDRFAKAKEALPQPNILMAGE